MGGGKKRSRSNTSGGTAKNTRKADDLSSLIDSLAKEASADSTAHKTTSKEERIQKRAAKKQKREQQKAESNNNRVQDQKKPAAVTKRNTTATRPHGTTSTSKKRLHQLAISCQQSLPKNKKKYSQPYDNAAATIKRRKTKKLDDATVQPRPKDYGGLGLARDTLLLSLEDPAFSRRLEEEFQEHVDGFFGKQRTKAMKKQLDGKMLWRQLQNKKKDKSFKNMTPDQRVEAMLKAGML